MKRFSFLVLFIAFISVVWAVDTETYYSTAEGKSGASLKTTLHKIIKNHTDVGYKGLYDVYETSDDRNGQVWDMYSTCTWYHGNKKCGNYSNICDCYNREHMIPQSWFDKASPMVSDAFHIYPTDGKVNGIRSNYPHGETNASAIGGKGLGKLGASSVLGYSGTVYEPADEYKGDIARTYFYFVTRYEDQLSSFDKNDVLTGNTYPSLTDWFYKLMLKWHRNDPVSQKEIDRNEAVYAHQHNRNPFIDYPELAEHIWGNKSSEAFYFDGGIGCFCDEERVRESVTVVGNMVQLSDLPRVDFTLSVYNLSGQLVYQADVNSGNHAFSLNHRGLYILKIDSVAVKIVIQ